MARLKMGTCSLSKRFNIKPGGTILYFLVDNDWDTQGAAAAVQGFEYALAFVAATSGEEFVNTDGNHGDR